ncbi:MAG TPA: transaldolase family protein, partial [Minicystis sp.]|nr:transaldolase family protein [Minicystis sp.]
DLATTLFRRLGRPNVMIKVPGTLEGVDAVEELVRRGVNVNITLLFSVPRYEAVAEAYLRGLERRAGRLDHGSASVASFFLSRIDAKVDPTLPEGSPARGELAIACAKLAHEQFLHRFSGARWRALVARGARPQRLLWASTMPKDAGARPTKYVDALLAPETVCTMPAKLVAAVHELGVVARRPITADLGEARALATRADYEDIAAELVDEGLAKFQASWDALVAALAPRLVRRAG